MKIDVTSQDLHRILSDAIAFASTDPNIPAIAAVRLESAPDTDATVHLLAVATDRFTLGVSRTLAEGDTGIGVTLAAADVKNVLRIAKTAKRDSGWRRATVTVHADDTVTFAFTSGESIVVRTVEAEFPRWRQLLSADVDAMARPAAGLGLDPMRLAQFAKVAAAKIHPMQLFPGVTESGSLKPVHVMIGEEFYGLIMPVKGTVYGMLFTYSAPAWLA
jgi:plastocyanin